MFNSDGPIIAMKQAVPGYQSQQYSQMVSSDLQIISP